MLYTYSVLLSCKFYTLLFSWYISYGSDEENLTWSKQFFFVIISFILPTNFFFFLISSDISKEKITMMLVIDGLNETLNDWLVAETIEINDLIIVW